jgi:hypothetical protein
VRVTPYTHTLAGDTPREIWAQTQRTTAPIVLLKRRLGDARWADVTRGIVERLEAMYGTQPVEITTTAYLGYGKKP